MAIRIVLSVFLYLGSCSIVEVDPVPNPARSNVRNAAWVYADVFASSERVEEFVRAAGTREFDTVYLNVYRPEENALGHRMYDDEAVADVIRRSHEAGIEIWAAYGNHDWPELGAREGSFPYRRFAEIDAFNRRHPDAAFDGVMLDVEPAEPVDIASILAFYRETLHVLHTFELEGAVAVRYFWKQNVLDPTKRSERAAHETVIDMPFDHVVVMGYRNYAGNPCIDNGLICLNEDHILYAHRIGKPRHVIVGLRTTSVETDAGSEVETFHGLPPTYIDAEMRRVAEFFSRYDGFGGFATHRLDVEVSSSIQERPIVAADGS